mgnify:CR=1 FL=1
MHSREPSTVYSLVSKGLGTYLTMTKTGYLRFWPLRVIALFPALVTSALIGCAGTPNSVNSVNSYALLTDPAKNRVQIAVERYVTCSVNAALKLDKGRRHAGRLAWTASESCRNEKADIIRTMVEQGASSEAAFSYASDSQVQATAMGITAIQSRRGH